MSNEKEEEVIEAIVEQKDENDADITDWKAEALKAQGIAKRFKTKLEKEKKVEEAKKAEAIPKDTSSEYLTKDEAILIARGMELEGLEKLKVIQKGMGGTLKEAYDSDLYQSYAKAKEAEAKRKKAQLGASGGGGKEDEGFNKPNMTAEEHRALWEKNRKK